MSAAEVIYNAYLTELQQHLGDVDLKAAPYRKIIEQDAEYLTEILRKVNIDERDVGFQDVGLRIHNPLQRLVHGTKNTIKRNSKEICVLGYMAVGSAILAAWVASGGTLAIGSVVAGVKISSAIHAALVGGASGATIAQILCG